MFFDKLMWDALIVLISGLGFACWVLAARGVGEDFLNFFMDVRNVQRIIIGVLKIKSNIVTWSGTLQIYIIDDIISSITIKLMSDILRRVF